VPPHSADDALEAARAGFDEEKDTKEPLIEEAATSSHHEEANDKDQSTMTKCEKINRS
jgi:hypothetical protein